MNFDNFVYDKKNVPHDLAESKLFFEERRKEFLEEIKKSDVLTHYFSKYMPATVEAFMLSYAERKAYLAENYEYYANRKYDTKELKFREPTERVFDLIRQKKLFNLQLLWRAEKVSIKEVKTTQDFQFWETHISHCPFIPEITDDDIDVMKKFLLDDSFSMLPKTFWGLGGWQFYDFIMEKDEEGDYDLMPDWYEFYDSHMGTSSLLLLPNIRGEKERFYHLLEREHTNAEFEKANKAKEEQAKLNPGSNTPVNPPPEHLSIGCNEMHLFAKRTEQDPHIVELFRIWKDFNNELSKTHKIDESDVIDIDIEEIIQMLKELEEAEKPPMMPGGIEWYEAIALCHKRYTCEMMYNDLYIVYQDYLLFQGTGISKGETMDQIMKEYEVSSKMYLDMLLKGRELNGDPRDLNF